MLIRIISLVFLFTTLNLSTVLSDEKTEFVYPKDKPSVFKKINTSKIVKNKNTLPKKKPKFENLNKVDKKKVIIEKKIPKKIKTKDNLKTKSISKFLYPKKKPVTYKVSLSNVEKSKILGKKDFERAKETFRLIKTSKWNSAIKYSEKVKNKEFQKLVKWMYLKQNGNRATFSEYKDFITKNNYYPRINNTVVAS